MHKAEKDVFLAFFSVVASYSNLSTLSFLVAKIRNKLELDSILQYI